MRHWTHYWSRETVSDATQHRLFDHAGSNADGAIVAPKQRRDGRLDPQTFRGVREITPTAAATFDRVLGEAA